MGFLAELLTAFRGRDEDNYSISDRTGGGYTREMTNAPPMPRQ